MICKVCGDTIRLGQRKDKNKALSIRLDAEIKYFGEFSPRGVL